MAASCKLCDKKIGILEASYSISDYVVCESCYQVYRDVIDNISDSEVFENELAKFKSTFEGKAGLDAIVNLMETYYEREKEKNKSEEEKEIAKRLAEEKARKEQEEKRRREEEAQIEAERLQREKIQQEYKRRIDNLTEMGLDGYYEYKVVSLTDNKSGEISSETIANTLNDLGLDGWHLRCAYTNELGKNSSSGGIGGFSAGTNSTIDDNILIFERFVRINRE